MTLLKRLSQWALRWRYPAVPVALGLLLALPSLWMGLYMDDFIIRTAVLETEFVEGISGSRWEPFTFLDGDPGHTRALMDHGLLPWWTDPECRLAFWRPLTALTHVLDYRVWPERPWLMHVQSLAWFALLIWAAAVLYRRLIGRGHTAWIAALAAVLFALDDAHAYPAGWLANRNSLLAGLFGILALVAHDRWRRDGWRTGAWLAPGALLAGLLAKEAAVSAGAYLLAYAIFLDREPRRSRWLSLLPYAVVGAAWYGVYRALGFGVAGSSVYVDPAHDPIGFVGQVVRNGPVLLLGQWGFPFADVSVLWSASAYGVHWLWAVAYLTLVAVLFAPLVRRDAVARFWTVGMLLSVLPACLAFPMDRLLVFVGLGAMGLVAQFLGGLKEGGPWVPRRALWRLPTGVLAVMLVLIHVVLAPGLFLLSVNLPRLMGRELDAAARGFPNDPQLRDQTVVVVNPGSMAVEWNITHLRHHRGEPLPRRRLQLTTASSAASLTRTDARTLVVRVRGGCLPGLGLWPGHPRPPALSPVYVDRLFDLLVRGDRNPFHVGQVIELETATVEITELTPDGRPVEVRFRFPVPLEAPSLRWLEVTPQGYAPFELPAVGETIQVAAVHR